VFFFFQAEDGIRDLTVTGVQTCALPISLSWVLVVAGAVALWAVRLTGPPDLMNWDQERPSAYVLDAVRNGHWACQRDWTGDITRSEERRVGKECRSPWVT